MTPDDALADELRRHLAELDVEILRLKRQIGELRSAISALMDEPLRMRRRPKRCLQVQR